ncbi:hypothetical protein GE061_005913 [Apolygus lucorum]|uniref:Odorant receptor n=1 Tax=Apolygus lucorum TaxID=248454 RepID=A0A1Q1NIK2_APOLU|nr:olfactory receptor [Apolygus lucorum]KAF6199615.1 hypothetical protein GE061_005913 [Apolygus lucorum]
MSDRHPDIAKYIKLMQATRNWYFAEDSTSHPAVDLLKRCYYHVRPSLFVFALLANGYGLYYREGFGALDGNLALFPQALASLVTSSTIYFNRRHHRKLTMLLNQRFLDKNEPWMVEIKNKYVSAVWKFIKAVILYQEFVKIFYVLAPVIVDSILHHIFDYLETPFFFPLTFSTFLTDDDKWTGRYYAVMFLNIWSGFEIVANLQGFIICYTVMTVFSVVELVILTEQIKSLDFYRSNGEINEQIRMVVKSHNDNIALNRELKAFLGPACAFLSLFTSLVLTLIVFTTTVTNDLMVILAYAVGAYFYFVAGLLYCSLGQLLDNQSSEVFDELCNLPWYRSSPDVRKSLNMMIRQAHNSLIIDYHGHYMMNLANFMNIMKSAYSYFTILQSVTGSD